MSARYVEIGRLCLVNFGPDQGKLVTILDVVDQNTVLVDGPTTEVPRQVMNLKRLALTNQKVPIFRGARRRTLRAALEKSNAVENFAKSSWARKLDKQSRRRALTDFDRFKLMLLRKKKAALLHKAIKTLRKSS